MNNKLLRFCLFFIASILSFSGNAFASSGELDVKELVLGHLGDAYEWHFFATENTEGVIPLPCIVRDENTHEWKCFLSSRIHEANEEGHADYEGFYFNEEKNGKIYQRLADGSSVRPLDFSITKDVSQIFLAGIILIVAFLFSARWYKKHDPTKDAPGGFVGMMESVVMFLVNDLSLIHI